MSGYKQAPIENSPSAPYQVKSTGLPDYRVLRKDLKEIEQQYKWGSVDKPVQSEDSPFVPESFEEKLDRLEPVVEHYKEQLLGKDPALFYTFVAIQAEAKEYFGTATVTDQFDLYLFAQDLFYDLTKKLPASHPVVTRAARAEANSIIRVIVDGLEYLHTIGDFSTALMYGRKLHDFVVSRDLDVESEVDAPLAMIYQFLGRTLRGRGVDDDYEQAIDYFFKCNESYAQRALSLRMSPDEIIYARTRAAVSLAFGAGFLFYNAKGDLVRARDAIAPARLAFLRDTGSICCKLYYHYFQLLYASILRDEAGELNLITHASGVPIESERAIAQAKLRQAKEIVDRCADAFAGRPKYSIHVLFNKALLLIYQGTEYYEQARACVEDLLDQCQYSPRWLANAFVLKSQLELRLGNVETAFADATKAHSHAGNHLPVKIEALLARGHVQLVRNNLSAARNDLQKALQLNDGTNLKWTALGNLLLVEVALKQNQPQQACETLVLVEEIMPSIRQGSIINRYRQLSAKVANIETDYLITSNTEILHYKKLERELQRWLLEKALREDNNITRVARRLQVTKKTIYMWLERYNIKIRPETSS
jgi:tetratricopeptide (TPR) repeat protein